MPLNQSDRNDQRLGHREPRPAAPSIQAATQKSALVSVTYDYLPNPVPAPVTPSASPGETYMPVVPFATPGYADGKTVLSTGMVATKFGEHVIVVSLTGAGRRSQQLRHLPLPKPTTTHHDLRRYRRTHAPRPTTPSASLGNGNLFTVLDHRHC